MNKPVHHLCHRPELLYFQRAALLSQMQLPVLSCSNLMSRIEQHVHLNHCSELECLQMAQVRQCRQLRSARMLFPSVHVSRVLQTIDVVPRDNASRLSRFRFRAFGLAEAIPQRMELLMLH